MWVVADRGNEIHAIRIDGSASRMIVPNWSNTQEMPSVSPDGYNLAFATYCELGVESIWVAPMSGIKTWGCGGARRLTPADGSFTRRPAWGPAELVAYERGRGTTDILLISEKGGMPFNLTNSDADDRNPAWSPRDTVIP